MTPRPIRGFRSGAASGAPGGAGHGGVRGGDASPRVLPLAGESSLAIDADAVRRRLGGWIATQPPSERPGVETLWREALLVCDQLVVLARATLGTAGVPLWLVDVRISSDAQELARAAGLSTRSVRGSVDALIAAEVVDGVSQVGSERVVRIRPETLTDAPVLAAVRWDVVRERLGDADVPVARLVVRELARRTTAEARLQGHFVSASQRDLADAAGYSKASMRRHLDALVAAGVIASRSRDRTNSWHRLAPVVFGVEAPAPAPAPAPARSPGARPLGVAPLPEPPFREPAVATRPGPDVVPTPPAGAPTARAIAAALTLEVNGVRVAIPPGVELTLEQDDTGALWYRAGALRLGPVRFG